MKISGVYKIMNTITGDFYIGSRNDAKRSWAEHKRKSVWNKCPNNQLYLDMRKYGIENFVFEVIEEAEESFLKETEQKFIETLKPTYNSNRANGWDIERYKEYQKEYQKTEKGKESHRKARDKYQNQLCLYNGETLTLHALVIRFSKAGVEHSAKEAKKYLLKKESNNAIEFYDIYP